MPRLDYRQLPIRWALSVAIAATTGAASAVNAQAPSATADTMTLSLAAALSRAMQRNEDIGIARSQVRGASAARIGAIGVSSTDQPAVELYAHAARPVLRHRARRRE